MIIFVYMKRILVVLMFALLPLMAGADIHLSESLTANILGIGLTVKI